MLSYRLVPSCEGQNSGHVHINLLISNCMFYLLQALILLINLVEHSKSNRKLLLEAKAPSDPESIFLRKFMSFIFL